jgi:hypothetical protein
MNKANYRIICHDDPFEETLLFSSLPELESCVADWFGGEGYSSVREFNKERRGIHSAQVKKNGRWMNIPWKKKQK